MIRQPIIVVLGHVDHGKTTLLDKIRHSNVAEKEAGKITQHIGATEVPLKEIERICSDLLKKFGFTLKIPGLLFIDTPGHEAFTNLRKRGGNIADIAILVIDIMQGIQPQTKESIEILKSYKTPFIVALNKIDKLDEWQSNNNSFLANLKKQTEKGIKQLDEKVYDIVVELYKEGFEAERFDRCTDFTKQIPIVPCSGMTGEGIAEILALISGLSQKFLTKNLEINEKDKGKGTVLEVKEEQGLGHTIDVILYDGAIKINDKIMLAGKNGIIKTKVKALLRPAALQEMRLGLNKFEQTKKASAAAGIKISALNLENAIAGSSMYVFDEKDEKEKEKEIETEIQEITIQNETIGVIIKADSLGSLEAITKLIEINEIPIRKAEVGNVTKKDVTEALTVKEKDELKAIIFAFNVKIDEQAKEEAKKRNITIISEKVIYKLLEEYNKWLAEIKNEEKNITLKKMVFPAKIKFLREHTFRHSGPAVIGIEVLTGKIKPGIKLLKNGKIIGEIKSIQSEGKNLQQAIKGEKVAIALSEAIVNKTIFEEDEFYSFIPKEQFDKIPKYFDLNQEEMKILEEIKIMERGEK